MTQHIETAKGGITIRSATAEDASGLFELRLEALSAHPEAFAADVEMTKARGVEAWAPEAAKDAREAPGVIVVASAGEKLTGMSGVGRGHWPKTQHSAFVWGVYVNRAWRGLGIAGAMLEECAAWAANHGVAVLKLGVVTSNQAAIHCYQRAGFSIYGTEPKTIYWDGAYYDEYLMAKLIPREELDLDAQR